MPPRYAEKDFNDPAKRPSVGSPRTFRDAFSIPRPIKILFDKVPLLTYPLDELPGQAVKAKDIPRLYVFLSQDQAADGRPSFNPSCLKWQTFLRIAGVDHRLVASNNHASPTGVLPFLLPAVSDSHDASELIRPIPPSKLIKYVADQGVRTPEVNDMRYVAFQSLLETNIRSAWLYTIYLEKRNFKHVAYPRYIAPTSSNSLVRATISHQLRQSAEAELLDGAAVIDVESLYLEAGKAFKALSVLLGDDPWFFASTSPSLFDASVFAYTHLLLDDAMGWRDERLCLALVEWRNLVQHRHRLLTRCYGE